MTDAFEHCGNDINQWKNMAEALANNASVLTMHRHHHQEDRIQYQQRLEISGVNMVFASLVLWGYALECFLKCLRLKRGHSLVKNGQLVGWGKNDDLVQMALSGRYQNNQIQKDRIDKSITNIVATVKIKTSR